MAQLRGRLMKRMIHWTISKSHHPRRWLRVPPGFNWSLFFSCLQSKEGSSKEKIALPPPLILIFVITSQFLIPWNRTDHASSLGVQGIRIIVSQSNCLIDHETIVYTGWCARVQRCAVVPDQRFYTEGRTATMENMENFSVHPRCKDTSLQSLTFTPWQVPHDRNWSPLLDCLVLFSVHMGTQEMNVRGCKMFLYIQDVHNLFFQRIRWWLLKEESNNQTTRLSSTTMCWDICIVYTQNSRLKND